MRKSGFRKTEPQKRSSKDKIKNPLSKMIMHYMYNGDGISVMLLIAIIICGIVACVASVTYQIAFMFITFILTMELFIYAFRQCYKGKVITVRKLGRYYINQKSSPARMEPAECPIHTLDRETIEAVEKIVIKKGKPLYVTTHYHIIKQLKRLEGIKLDYRDDDYVLMDLSRDKKQLTRKSPGCAKCKYRQSCNLFKPQTVKMYNIIIKPDKDKE